MKKLVKWLALFAVVSATAGIVACKERTHVHSYSEVVTAPTCMKQGYTTHTCSCGDSYVDSQTKSVGHHGGTATCIAYAVCEDCGYTYGEYGDHLFVNAYCTVCDEYEGSEGLAYILNEDGASYSVLNAGTCLLTEIKIPSIYKNLPVTALADRAFYEYNAIQEIRLPKTITSIGDLALSSCRQLKRLKIDKANTAFKVVENVLYSADGKTLIAYANAKSEKTFEVPDGVEIIADGAFDGAGNLTSISLPDSVTYIGDQAFAWCEALTSVRIPQNVREIGQNVFFRTDIITQKSENVCYVGDEENPYRFAVGIESTALSYTIKAQTKLIDPAIFSDCQTTTAITVEAGNTVYKEIAGNLYSADGTELIRYATGKNAISFSVPETVTKIGEYAFSGSKKLQKIDVHNGVQSVGENAFYGCSNLTVYCESKQIPGGWDEDWNSSYCSVAQGYRMSNGVSIYNKKAVEKNESLSLKAPTVSGGGTVSSYTVEYKKIESDTWETLDVAGGQKMPTNITGSYLLRYTINGQLSDNSALDGIFVSVLYIKDPDVAYDFEGEDVFHGGTNYYPGSHNNLPRYEIAYTANNNYGFRIYCSGESWEGVYYDTAKSIGYTCKGMRMRIYASAPISLRLSISAGEGWNEKTVLLQAGWNDVSISLPDFTKIKGITFKQSKNQPLIVVDDIYYIAK